MKEHILKIEQNYLDRLLAGSKTCELRDNDRDFQLGDSISFLVKDSTCEWVVPERSCQYIVTHVLPVSAVLATNANYVVLSLKVKEN